MRPTYLRLHTRPFNAVWGSADPYESMDPTNHPDSYDEPYKCHSCNDEIVKAEGDLCAGCYSDYVNHLND